MNTQSHAEPALHPGPPANQPGDGPNDTLTPGPDGQGQDPQPLTRRNFVRIGIGALGTLSLLEVVGASALFLRARSLEGKYGGLVVAGQVDSFPPGSVTEFPEGRFFLIRAQDGGFIALHSRCPHLGCAVHWSGQENRFLCPCHASSFDGYGNFESPPVSRPLDAFPLVIEETMIRVDTAKLQRRTSFEQEQLTYA